MQEISQATKHYIHYWLTGQFSLLTDALIILLHIISEAVVDNGSSCIIVQ